MKKHSVIIGAAILTLAGIIAKSIGAFYRIPLANILGSNGMGVYYLIFPIYSLLLVLVSSGVSIAVSKMISYERASNNRKNEITIFRVAIVYVFILSVVFSLLLVLFNNQISLLQGNVNASLGYFAIAPAIIFASLISVVRAYFQGLQNMIPTSVSNIVEQVVKVVFGLVLANLLLYRGIEVAVFGSILAVTISEFVGFIIIVINFLSYKKKLRYYYEPKPVTSQTLTQLQAFKKLFKYSLPATLSSLIIPITAFLDSFMVINLMVKSGISSDVATSLYGIQNGMVNTMVGLPVIFTLSLSTAIVPNLSSFHAKNNQKEVSEKSTFFVKITWLFALPAFIMLFVFSPDIIRILFSKGLSSKVFNEFDFAFKLLMLASVGVIYYAFLQTFTSILQSINKPLVPFISLFFALLVRVGLVYTLGSEPTLNIFGVVFANIVFLSIATTVNLVFVKKYINFNFSANKMFVVPVFSGAVAGVVAYFLKVMLSEYLQTIFYTAISGLVGVLVYVVLIYVLKVFNKKEMEMFPKLKKLTKRKKRV